MTYTITGWWDPETGVYTARVRTLTEPLTDHPEMDGVYRRVIEEYMPNDAGLDPDPDSFVRRDLADDETVPEDEQPYTYYEMHS
jgi:hypothetical protein